MVYTLNENFQVTVRVIDDGVCLASKRFNFNKI